MNHYYTAFEEVIQEARRRPTFPLEAKLILQGRISYAVERGEITIKEARSLEDMIGDDLRTKFLDALQIATYGNTDAELMASPA